ncbi:MAG: hypothetical protein IPG82_17940 [Saprospiraceae bacterium]|nr:hypothetical protein [Saprospiraceae bacterium]
MNIHFKDIEAVNTNIASITLVYIIMSLHKGYFTHELHIKSGSNTTTTWNKEKAPAS